MYYDWLAEAIYVEAAFLNTDVDEDISIETPQGLKEIEKDVQVCKLLYGMYIRNSSSTRCWSTTIVKYVNSKPGMKESKIDTMLSIYRNNDGRIEGLLVNYMVPECYT